MKKFCPSCHPKARELVKAVREGTSRGKSASKKVSPPPPPGTSNRGQSRPPSHAAASRPSGSEPRPIPGSTAQKRKGRESPADGGTTDSTGGDATNNNAGKRSEDDDDRSITDEEAALLDEEGLSAKAAYDAAVEESESAYALGVLLAMRVGMVGDVYERIDVRIAEFKKKDWLKAREVQVKSDFLEAEIKRRFKARKVTDDEFSGKMVGLSNRNNKWRTELLEGKIPGQEEDYLPLLSDEKWLARKAVEILDSIEASKQRRERESRESGGHMKLTTVLLMRAIHAWLDDAQRDLLMKQFDIFGRLKIDSRNSAHRDLTIMERTANTYNRREWIPKSLLLPDLHSRFNVEMDLALPDGAVDVTAEGIGKLLSNLLSLLKKAESGWKASGNGKANRVEDGKRVVVRLLGTDYDSERIEGIEYDDEGEGVEIEYADDDRFKFCFSNVALAYLWGYLEAIGLSTFAVQNCARVGLVDGKCASARSTGGLMSRNRPRQQQNALSLERMYNQLPDLMKVCMVRKDLEERLVQLEDQLRKQTALFSTCENDHDDAKLAMLTYEHTANPLIQGILDFHRDIVARKQRALDEAAAKKAEWEEQIAKLKVEIERAAAAPPSNDATNSHSASDLARIGGAEGGEEEMEKETDNLHSMEEGDLHDSEDNLLEEAAGLKEYLDETTGLNDDDDDGDDGAGLKNDGDVAALLGLANGEMKVNSPLSKEEIRSVTNELYNNPEDETAVWKGRIEDPKAVDGFGHCC